MFQFDLFEEGQFDQSVCFSLLGDTVLEAWFEAFLDGVPLNRRTLASVEVYKIHEVEEPYRLSFRYACRVLQGHLTSEPQASS